MYYIGVDGGGTKTVYTLFNENKETLDEVKTPGSNHENMEGSFDEASEIIWSGLTALVEKRGISLDDVSFTLMGLAGIDHPYQHDEMQIELGKLGITGARIYNDGFIVIKAGVGAGAGIGGGDNAENEEITIRGNAVVTAIADPFMNDETKAFCEGFGVEKIYTDYKKIIEDETIDAVLVCSSTDTQAPISIEAIVIGYFLLSGFLMPS